MLHKFSAQCITENAYTLLHHMYAYVELLLSLRVHSVVSPPLLNEINLGKYVGIKTRNNDTKT